MKVILKQDVKALGKKGDLVQVNAGEDKGKQGKVLKYSSQNQCV
jgi:ribosomal protein L9